jgi:hypothetical protein
MSTPLDPQIAAKLAAFAQRRRKLIIIRGVASGLAMLLATMMFVALVDWLFVLPDGVRWALTGVAYLAVIVTEWRSCLRLLAHAPGPKRLARLVEHAEPKLREDLLSAVELGGGEAREVVDSEQFRALLQSDVASRVEKLDMQQLLPVKLLRTYLGIAAAILLALIVGFIATGAQLGTLLMRALLPMANFARVSAVKVEIVAPNPADRVVAQGDTEPLVIRLSGRRANKAFLETFTASGGREVIQMTPVGDERFTSTIQVAREDVQYRVRAGDALTRKYQLSSLARPAVVQFAKTYTYPAYTKVAPKQLVEDHGDLAALEGSEVELRLSVNQKVKTAELRIEQGKQASYTVALTPDGDQLLARVPLKASGVYRVHLVGADSGFENKFSPEYELRAEADLVPEVEIELPKQDLILPANEIVDLRGTASDDQSLAKVAQLVKINDGPWLETLLATEPGQRTTVERRWDLFEQGAKPGDLLTTKLVAFDRKGSRAESRPVQVTITASGFEAKRLLTLEAERELHRMLRELRSAADVFERAATDAREQFERLPDGDAQRQPVLAGLTGKADEFLQKTAAVGQQLRVTLKDAPAGHESAALVLLGRQLARIEAGGVQFARSALEVLGGDLAAPTAREQLREVVEHCVRSTQRARLAEDLYRKILSANEVDVLAENLQVVNKEQERLLALAEGSGEDARKWAQLADRIRVVLSETKSLEDAMLPLGERAEHGEIRSRVPKLQKKLLEQRNNVVRILSERGPGRDLLDPTRELTRTLAEGARQLLDSRRASAKLAADALRTMRADAGPVFEPLEKLPGEAAQIVKNQRLSSMSRGGLLDARWESKTSWLKTNGDLEEVRPTSDTYYVSDLRQTTLALPPLKAAVAEGGVEKSAPALVALDKDFRVLESGHTLSEILDGLRTLSDAERWELVAARARTSNPRNWEWLEARLREVPNEFSRTNLDGDLRKLMEAVRKIVSDVDRLEAFRTVDREMREREKVDRLPERRTAELDEIAVVVRQALELLRPAMEQARQDIAALAPKLHQMMQQLAKQTEQLKQETQQQAAKTEEKKPEEGQAEAKQQLAKQEKLNEQIDELKDAIRAEANKQDVMQAEGRERARDADDALAMLKEPPKKAAEALSEATRSEAPQVQKQALTDAATQQQKLAETLQQLAQHYENVEQGKAQESRTALRATEQENGIKQELDEQYKKAAELAEMAQKTPQEMLAQLEKALPKNPVMQQELSAISRNTLTEAQQQLAQASKQESAVAQEVQKMAAEQPPQTPPPSAPRPGENPPASPQFNQTPASPNASPANSQNPMPSAAPNPQLAQVAKKQPEIANAAMQAGDQVQRAGRHEERMSNPASGQQLQKLGQQIAETAEKAVPQAQQALEKAQMAGEAQTAVNAADTELKSQLRQLESAASPALPTPGEKPVMAAATPDAQASPSAPPPGKPAAAQAAQSPAGQNPPSASPPQVQPAVPGGQPPAPQMAQSQPGQPAAPAMSPQSPESLLDQLTNLTAATPTPQEQVWMARTLDALDQALNASASQSAESGQPAQPGKQGQQPPQGQPGQKPGQQPGQPQPGQQAGQQPAGQPQSAMSPAQQALAAAAQAAAAAMRASRNESQSQKEGGDVAQSEMQAVSKGGAKVDAGSNPYGAMPDAKGLRNGEWGKLPKKMAEQMTQGQREAVAGEYRNQVETYYRVIAEKAKAP